MKKMDYLEAVETILRKRDVKVLRGGVVREAQVFFTGDGVRIAWKCEEGYSVSTEEMDNYGKTWAILSEDE